MAYKWKPSKAQRKEFAIRMQNQEEKASYEERKVQKANKRKSNSKYDYQTAGGNYVQTREQHDFCLNNMALFTSASEIEAANMVMFGFNCQEKVHHDYIHIVNEKRRIQNTLS